MFNRIKHRRKQAKCQHSMGIHKWQWIHDYNKDYITVKYICSKCNKQDELYLFNQDAVEWDAVMGEYKKDEAIEICT